MVICLSSTDSEVMWDLYLVICRNIVNFWLGILESWLDGPTAEICLKEVLKKGVKL